MDVGAPLASTPRVPVFHHLQTLKLYWNSIDFLARFLHICFPPATAEDSPAEAVSAPGEEAAAAVRSVELVYEYQLPIDESRFERKNVKRVRVPRPVEAGGHGDAAAEERRGENEASGAVAQHHLATRVRVRVVAHRTALAARASRSVAHQSGARRRRHVWRRGRGERRRGSRAGIRRQHARARRRTRRRLADAP